MLPSILVTWWWWWWWWWAKFWITFHLDKNHHSYEAKLQANFVIFPSILSFETMNLQQNIFKCIMKVDVVITTEPSFHMNLFTRLQWTLSISRILINYFIEFFKLANIVAIQILRNVEDEHTFSTFSFIKSKLWNRLCEHLQLLWACFPNLSSHSRTFHIDALPSSL